MTKTTRRWYILGWLAYSGYELLGNALEHRGKASLRMGLWLTVSLLLIRFVEFTLCYQVVYPRLLRPGRAGALVAALGGVVGHYIVLRAGLEEVLYPAVLGFHNYTPDTTVSYYIYDNIFYALPVLAVSAAVWAGQQALHRERENQQLRDEKRLAETVFLKTQLNPHFLYNTLNLLYGMAHPAAKPLAAAILKLADLMRYVLHEEPDGQVDLGQEIDYLHNYLALCHLRFPDQFFVDFTITGEPAGHRIAPLLLIPFVENAFKHGVLDDADHPVRLRLTIRPAEIVFAVQNRISDHRKDPTSGIGLPNLRRRLALLYPSRHALRIVPKNRQFNTLLRLNQ